MMTQHRPSFLSDYVSTYEYPMTTAQRRLDRLVETIEGCKFALRAKPIDGRQSVMAHQLVAALDQGIDELATQLSGGVAFQNDASHITEHLDRLDSICKQLAQALDGTTGGCLSDS